MNGNGDLLLPRRRRTQACRIAAGPPRWPVSGLADACRVPFPSVSADSGLLYTAVRPKAVASA